MMIELALLALIALFSWWIAGRVMDRLEKMR